MSVNPFHAVLERAPHRVVVPALLAIFLIAGFLSLRGDSATSDETAHIGAGISYLDRRDFRMNPEHPPLVKAWAALPVAALGLAEPDYGSRAWNGSPGAPGATRTLADQWTFGFEILNGPLAAAARRDPARILVPARTMVLLLGAALGLLVYAWSRALWGKTGGIVSLFLFALSPTMLAHARLVTTDLAAAGGIAVAVWTLRRHLAHPSWSRLVVAGCALGAALLTKFSTLLLGPILAGCALAWIVLSGSTNRAKRAAIAAGSLAAMAVIAWGVIWAGYAFRYAASTDPGHVLPWEARAQTRFGIPGPVAWARAHAVLPEAYLFGVTAAVQDEVRLAFLNGEESEIGWRSYFPIAFALKTPPALMLLAGWALAAGLRRRRVAPADIAFIAVPLLVYAAFTVRSRLNIGHRHLAPLDPFLFVACGCLPALAAASRIRAWIAAALLAAYAVSFAAATPGYLSYFNVIGGGARHGWRHLLDSNIDWGQDLGRLASWLRGRGIEEIPLAYFGTADPKAYGLRYRKIAMVHDFRPEEPAARPAPGELAAVSVNLLQGLYLGRDRELAEEAWRRGWISLDRVREYTRMRTSQIEARMPYPGFGAWAVARGYLDDKRVAAAREGLLTTWMDRLRERGEIVGRAGDSILILRVP